MEALSHTSRRMDGLMRVRLPVGGASGGFGFCGAAGGDVVKAKHESVAMGLVLRQNTRVS